MDPPPTSPDGEILDGKLIERSPMVIMLVVDDASTPSAAELRARIAESVRAGLLSELEERWSSCGSPDPAAWHPGDVRVAVVRPSAPDAVALLTPIAWPSLAWITKSSTKEEVEAVVAGAVEALGQRLASLDEPYRPLRAAKRAAELVRGMRAPETSDEAAFVASLPPRLLLRLVIAGSRDDEDLTSVKSLTLDAGLRDSMMTVSVVGPFGASPEICSPAPGPASTRLQDWASAQMGFGISEVMGWPCDSQTRWDHLLSSCCADCGPACRSRPLSVLPDGSVECRYYVDQADLDRCDPEHGWRDPDGTPRMVDRFGTMMRRCELVQLTGEALDACRTSLDCPACGSGWCATEVPSLVPRADACSSEGEYAWPLRFVGGALDAPGGFVHVECFSSDP